MTFKFTGLDPAPFTPLFDLDDDALQARHIVPYLADSAPGYPCRVSLREAPLHARVLLVNHTHLDVASPYASRHAIFVAQDQDRADLPPDQVPEVVTNRLVSLRAFDGNDHIIQADVCDGQRPTACCKPSLPTRRSPLSMRMRRNGAVFWPAPNGPSARIGNAPFTDLGQSRPRLTKHFRIQALTGPSSLIRSRPAGCGFVIHRGKFGA